MGRGLVVLDQGRPTSPLHLHPGPAGAVSRPFEQHRPGPTARLSREPLQGSASNSHGIFRPAPAREAFAIYQLGVELCILGKTRIGRGLLWEAAKLALVDIRALDCLGRALWKMVRFAALPVRVGAPAAPKTP